MCEKDPEDIAYKIKWFLEIDKEKYQKISLDCRELIIKKGTTDDLFLKISKEIIQNLFR